MKSQTWYKMRYKNNTKHVQKIKISHDIKSIYKKGLKTRMRNFLHYLRQDVWKFFKKFYFVCKVVFKCSFSFFCHSIYHFVCYFFVIVLDIWCKKIRKRILHNFLDNISNTFLSSKSEKKRCWVTNFVKATLMLVL